MKAKASVWAPPEISFPHDTRSAIATTPRCPRQPCIPVRCTESDFVRFKNLRDCIDSSQLQTQELSPRQLLLENPCVSLEPRRPWLNVICTFDDCLEVGELFVHGWRHLASDNLHSTHCGYSHNYRIQPIVRSSFGASRNRNLTCVVTRQRRVGVNLVPVFPPILPPLL